MQKGLGCKTASGRMCLSGHLPLSLTLSNEVFLSSPKQFPMKYGIASMIDSFIPTTTQRHRGLIIYNRLNCFGLLREIKAQLQEELIQFFVGRLS